MNYSSSSYTWLQLLLIKSITFKEIVFIQIACLPIEREFGVMYILFVFNLVVFFSSTPHSAIASSFSWLCVHHMCGGTVNGKPSHYWPIVHKRANNFMGATQTIRVQSVIEMVTIQLALCFYLHFYHICKPFFFNSIFFCWATMQMKILILKSLWRNERNCCNISSFFRIGRFPTYTHTKKTNQILHIVFTNI